MAVEDFIQSQYARHGCMTGPPDVLAAERDMHPKGAHLWRSGEMQRSNRYRYFLIYQSLYVYLKMSKDTKHADEMSRDSDQKRKDSLGWLTQSSVQPKKRKEISGISFDFPRICSSLPIHE